MPNMPQRRALTEFEIAVIVSEIFLKLKVSVISDKRYPVYQRVIEHLVLCAVCSVQCGQLGSVA